MSKVLVWIAVAAVAAVALACAARLRAERIFAVRGCVVAPLADGRVVVAHEEVVGYMPAMTMGFEVAPGAEPEARALHEGDRVEFTLRADDEHVQASHFRVIGRASEAPAVAAPRRTIAASGSGRRLREGDVMPAFALRDEEDRPLTRQSLLGHVTVLTFIFTRCPVPEYCPLVSRRFGELQRAILANPELNGRVRLLSITLDPAFDRSPVLAAYGRGVGADPAVWNFATGSDDAIGALVTAFSVYRERNGVVLDHTLCTALVDAQGRVVELWRGNGWKTDEVLGAIRATPATAGEPAR